MDGTVQILRAPQGNFEAAALAAAIEAQVTEHGTLILDALIPGRGV